MALTNKQIGYAWSLLRNAGFEDKEDKEGYIRELTQGRTEHISDLSYEEMQQLVKALDTTLESKQKMVNKVLSLAHEMRWELPDGKVNMESVNEFCKQKTRFQKPLDELKYNELPEVVTIFEKMHLNFLKAL